MITLTRYKSFKLNIIINSNPKPKQMNNTKAICGAMSILSILDNFIKANKGKKFTEILDELDPILSNIEDDNIREHFLTLIDLRISKLNPEAKSF